MAIESRGINDIVNPYFDLTGFYARLDFHSIDFSKANSIFSVQCEFVWILNRRKKQINSSNLWQNI